MKFEYFLSHYRPIDNHIDHNATCDGKGFETYGNELDFVRKQPFCSIWTAVETDGGGITIIPGFLSVNRQFYLITEVLWDEGAGEVEYFSDEEAQEMEKGTLNQVDTTPE